MQWLRLYSGTASDPKIFACARKARASRIEAYGVWCYCLEYANQANSRGSLDGLHVEDIAANFDMDEDVIQSLMNAFRDRGMIIEGRIANWDKRQRISDSSAERVQRHRERRKQTDNSNGDVTLHAGDVTGRNGTGTGGNGNGTGGSADATEASQEETADFSAEIAEHDELDGNAGVTLQERYETAPDTDTDLDGITVAIATSTVVSASGYQTIPEFTDLPTADDVKARLFGPALKWLKAKTGNSEKSCRTLMGRFVRDHGPEKTYETLQRMRVEQPIDPTSWLNAHLPDLKKGQNNGRHASQRNAGSRGPAPQSEIFDTTDEWVREAESAHGYH